MALLKWGEDERKKDELLGAPVNGRIQSVQESWQPTSDNASGGAPNSSSSGNGSYLFSEEKARVDEAKAQNDAAEAAAQAQAAEANRAAAAAAVAAQNNETEQQVARPKYRKQEKKSEGILGFLKGIGAGVQQGVSALGDIAVQGGGAIDYAAQRMRGVGADDAARSVDRRYGDLRSLLHGARDITGNEMTGTRDVDESAARIARGDASARDIISVAGKGLQAGVDATMFLNPSRIAAGAITPAVRQPVNIASKILQNPAVRYAARDAALFGGLQGAATGLSTYGQTGQFGEAAKNAAIDAVIGGALQGALDLGGQGINVAANRTLGALRNRRGVNVDIDAPRTPVDEAIAGIERQQTPNPATQDGNVSFERTLGNSELGQSSGILDNNTFTPVARDVEGAQPIVDTPEVADGVVTPRTMEEPNIEPQTPQVLDEVVPVPTVDGVPVTSSPVTPVRSETPVDVQKLKDSRAGKSQAEEAEINQSIKEIERAIPVDKSSVPKGMSDDYTPVAKPVNPESDFAKRFMTTSGNPAQTRQEIANAVGLRQDGSSDLATILSDGNVKPKVADRITKIHDELEAIAQRNASTQKQYQKDFVAGKELSDVPARARNRDTSRAATLQAQLTSELKALKRQGVKGLPESATQFLENVNNGRLATMLSGAGLVERNVVQEGLANVISAAKNPIKTVRGATNHGSQIKSAVKSSADGWKETPKTASELFQYITGNTYKTAMTPTQVLANQRKGAFRTELTQWAYKDRLGKDLSLKEAEKLSRTAGNITESLVNTLAGVDNGMVSSRQAMKALKQWKEYIKSGSNADLTKLENMLQRQSTFAERMMKGFEFGDDSKRGRLVRTMVNGMFPFMRTAYNLTSTGITRNLNPVSKSIIDTIRADQRSGGKNAMNILKNKLVDYGIIGGAAMLVNDGIVGYNDGEDVDKPRGVYIDLGNDKYMPIRATPIEMPLAVAALAGQLVKDAKSGHMRNFDYYQGILTGSLPYLDQLEQNTNIIDSAKHIGGKDGDGGYAAKQYAVGLAKSYLPFSNNGIQAYVEGKKGESLNAKTVYDKDFMTWLNNSVMSAYSPTFREGLKDSRDAAGRVRTVDNQGAVVNKTINDKNTAIFNDNVTNLVTYARQNDLGNGTAEMFNTYDTGKNNNFKSVQDTITFLDTNGEKPDNAKKLEVNSKLHGMAQQIRSGFFGDTGSELLTLDGKNVYSDVSVPGKNGGKNTRLPLSMESIKNAIAQTDLPEDQRTALFEIGQQKNGLFERRKAGEISYDQEKAMRADIAKQEQELLQNSESYKKLSSLMNELDSTGFFDEGGIGSTKSGQTYLWNSLNALLGSKGATPAANYPESKKGFGGGRGGGKSFSGARGEGIDGVKWTPVKSRQMAITKTKGYTPVNIKVKLGNEIRRDKSRDYADRTF